MSTRRDRATEFRRALEYRRQLRKRATDAERLLWSVLRNRRLKGHKFRRQHSIQGFIVHFVCLELRLIIELDGEYHDYVSERDLERQAILQQSGYRVFRFSNDKVLSDVEAVMIAIVRWFSDDHAAS